MAGFHRILGALLIMATITAFTPAIAADPEPRQADTTEAGEIAPATVIEEQVIPPQVIIKSQVTPDYPPAALAARMEGVVVVELVVLKDGTVGEGKVLKCSHPNVGFEEAAIDATKQWRFEAALKEGEPIDYAASFRVNFRVSGGQPYVSWGASGTMNNSQTKRPALSSTARTSGIGK